MWTCIPIAAIVCGAFVVSPIIHRNEFIEHHPIPPCHVETKCHMVWEPDNTPEGFKPGDLYVPYSPQVVEDHGKWDDDHHDHPSPTPNPIPEPAGLPILLFSIGIAIVLHNRYARNTLD